MANNLQSTLRSKCMPSFVDAFQNERKASKSVNTTALRGAFGPTTGKTAGVRRHLDFTTVETAEGDLTGLSKSIVTSEATAFAQPIISVPVEWTTVEQAVELGNMDDIMKPIARRMVTKLELNFSKFIMETAALRYGTPGVGVQKWSDIAGAGALMEASGVPQDKDWAYLVHPHNRIALADDQRGLAVNPEVKTAHEKATIARNYANFNVMTSTTGSSYRTGTGADRTGTLSTSPDVTYATNKDSLTQTLTVTGFQPNLVIAAGEVISITGRNRLNLSTREVVTDEDGVEVVFTGTVAQTVPLDGSGAGVIIMNGAAIYEANGAYNTVDSAPVSGDIVTLEGPQSKLIKPNMFFHPDAYALTSIPLPALSATDAGYQTDDGLAFRITKYANAEANVNKVRFDFYPVFCCMNPFMAGHGYGTV